MADDEHYSEGEETLGPDLSDVEDYLGSLVEDMADHDRQSELREIDAEELARLSSLFDSAAFSKLTQEEQWNRAIQFLRESDHLNRPTFRSEEIATRPHFYIRVRGLGPKHDEQSANQPDFSQQDLDSITFSSEGGCEIGGAGQGSQKGEEEERSVPFIDFASLRNASHEDNPSAPSASGEPEDPPRAARQPNGSRPKKGKKGQDTSASSSKADKAIRDALDKACLEEARQWNAKQTAKSSVPRTSPSVTTASGSAATKTERPKRRIVTTTTVKVPYEQSTNDEGILLCRRDECSLSGSVKSLGVLLGLTVGTKKQQEIIMSEQEIHGRVNYFKDLVARQGFHEQLKSDESEISSVFDKRTRKNVRRMVKLHAEMLEGGATRFTASANPRGELLTRNQRERQGDANTIPGRAGYWWSS